MFFGGLLLAPVLADEVMDKPHANRSFWLYVYIFFISSTLLLSLFSVDFQVSAFDIRRNIRLCGLRITSKVLARRSELKALCRTSTPVWEHKGAFAKMQIDAYLHEVHLVTLDDHHIPFLSFRNVLKDSPELARLLAQSGEYLQLPVENRFHH